MTTAVVLSGGGSLGTVQVGMLCALADRGIMPDLVVGTSVGAVNGAYIAGRPGPGGVEALSRIWESVRRSDIFPVQPFLGLSALAGRSDHIVPNDKFRRLLRRNLTYSDVEKASCRLCLVATEVKTGNGVVLSDGPVIEAVLASVAVPGVFPPVRIGSQYLMDGAVANNTPISAAVQAGATTLYVLHAGYACALSMPPRSALGMALQALTVVLQQRLLADVSALEKSVRLHVVPPLCPMEVSPVDFGHNGELIARARDATREWLASGMPSDPIQALRVHEHG